MLTVLLCVLAAPVLAEDWHRLDRDGITTALSARVVQYEDGATQNFYTDGRTLREVGEGASWGTWWVEAGLYCSTWPPSATKTCYAVESRDLDIRFVSAGGSVTVGRYIDL